MPKTMIGIVYDVHTLALRHIFIPDDDKQLSNGTHRLGNGEAMITSPLWKGADLDTAMAAIANAMGRVPPPLDIVHVNDAVVRSMGICHVVRVS